MEGTQSPPHIAAPTTPARNAEREASPQPTQPTLHPYPRPVHASSTRRDSVAPMSAPTSSPGTAQSPQAHPPALQAQASAQHAPAYYSPFPALDCVCPTCMYYKWAMVQHHSGQPSGLSPMAHTFVPYEGQGMAPSMEPSHGRSPTLTSPSYRRSQRPAPISDAAVEAEFDAAVGSLVDLACTAPGRTLLQQVIRAKGESAINTLLEEFVPEIERVALDPHGCHVLRSLIEVLNDESVVLLINSFSDTLVLNMCTVSQYTRRILQALFERQQCYDLQGVVDILSRSAVYLAATQQGCISLMRIFEQVNGEQKHQLALPMLPMMCSLASDPFGNYVVQCILQHSSAAVAVRYVANTMVGHFEALACNKYASNVLETIARAPTMSLVRRMVVDELLVPATFSRIVHDAYGNFVVQALIDTCDTLQEMRRMNDLRYAIARSQYATKIEGKLRSKKATLDALSRGHVGGVPSYGTHNVSVVPVA